MDQRISRLRVLFLCTGNSCRSQMAEGFLRHYAGELIEVHSAGMEPAAAVHPMAVRVMQEKGIDISAQQPKGISKYLGKLLVHYVVIVCDRAARACPTTWPNAMVRLVWPFEDPAAFSGSEQETVAKFREVRDQIEAAILHWIEELRHSDPRFAAVSNQS